MPLPLDPHILSEESKKLQFELSCKIVGQQRAIHQFVQTFQKHQVGLFDPHRPMATLLFLGPTGCGKTSIVHALAEIFFDDQDALIRIDGGEFREGHEISKIIGSPPGYIGHKDEPRITQPKLAAHFKKDQENFSILLFDEIEKAHHALHELLLGALDYGKLTLGGGEEVDLTRTIIVMTSNLGSKDTQKLVNRAHLGFQVPREDHDTLDQKIYEVALSAAKKFFRPELLNRIDRTIVFRSLSEDGLRDVLALELTKVQQRVLDTKLKFMFRISQVAKDFLLEKGTSQAYGAREIKRTVERFVAEPLAALMGSQQVDGCDTVIMDYVTGEKELSFSKVTDPLLSVKLLT